MHQFRETLGTICWHKREDIWTKSHMWYPVISLNESCKVVGFVLHRWEKVERKCQWPQKEKLGHFLSQYSLNFTTGGVSWISFYYPWRKSCRTNERQIFLNLSLMLYQMLLLKTYHTFECKTVTQVTEKEYSLMWWYYAMNKEKKLELMMCV